MQSILIYGGSFDPPHAGHLNVALNVQQYFHFERFFFLPCKVPLLKNPTQAGTIDRLNMLQLMLKENTEMSISTVEIERASPSYMSETLKTFRDNFGNAASITLLLGMDSFLTLPQWEHFESIPLLSNLLVIRRQPTPPPATVEQSYHLNLDNNIEKKETFGIPEVPPLSLLNNTHGKIAYFDAGFYPISSSLLREKIRLKQPIGDDCPQAVDKYIQLHGLYHGT
jgi:nicotinate-nucleotide adenylyltransferase